MPKQFTLGKKERLKSRKQIEHLFREGQGFTIPSFRVFFSWLNESTEARAALQFGVGVSSRSFRKATDRNSVKRLAREAWRLQKKQLEEKLAEHNRPLNVFIIYTGRELPVFADVMAKVNTILHRLEKSMDTKK